MNNLIKWINQINSKKIRIILSFISLLLYLLMITKIFGINKEFDNIYMLDLKFFYTGSTFINTFKNISIKQIGYYNLTHYIDYIFILIFYPLFVLFLNRVMSSNSRIILLPIIPMLFDFLENFIIDFHLKYGVNQFFGSLCGIFTSLKFILLFIILILLLIFSIRLLIKKIYKH